MVGSRPFFNGIEEGTGSPKRMPWQPTPCGDRRPPSEALLALVKVGFVLPSGVGEDADRPRKNGRLTIEPVMRPRHLENTGMAALRAEQPRALDICLDEYTKHVLEVALATHEATLGAPRSKVSLDVGGGHPVEEVIARAKTAVLGDGPLWEVAAIGRLDAML